MKLCFQQTVTGSVGEPPIVKTESVKYDPSTYSPSTQAHPTTHVPVVQTESRKVCEMTLKSGKM